MKLSQLSYLEGIHASNEPWGPFTRGTLQLFTSISSFLLDCSFPGIRIHVWTNSSDLHIVSLFNKYLFSEHILPAKCWSVIHDYIGKELQTTKEMYTIQEWPNLFSGTQHWVVLIFLQVPNGQFLAPLLCLNQTQSSLQLRWDLLLLPGLLCKEIWNMN